MQKEIVDTYFKKDDDDDDILGEAGEEESLIHSLVAGSSFAASQLSTMSCIDPDTTKKNAATK